MCVWLRHASESVALDLADLRKAFAEETTSKARQLRGLRLGADELKVRKDACIQSTGGGVRVLSPPSCVTPVGLFSKSCWRMGAGGEGQTTDKPITGGQSKKKNSSTMVASSGCCISHLLPCIHMEQ